MEQAQEIPLTRGLRDTDPCSLQTTEFQQNFNKQKITWTMTVLKQSISTTAAIHLSL